MILFSKEIDTWLNAQWAVANVWLPHLIGAVFLGLAFLYVLRGIMMYLHFIAKIQANILLKNTIKEVTYPYFNFIYPTAFLIYGIFLLSL